MNGQLVAILAQISAANARVAAMQAENAVRQHCGHSPAYDESAFMAEAFGLDELSRNALAVA